MLNCGERGGLDRGHLEIAPGGIGLRFSLKVEKGWAKWAFSKRDPNKAIAALELLATLIVVKLWVPEGQERQSSRVAIKGYIDNHSNELLVKKFMTSKYPSTLILMELAEELAGKQCELKLHWVKRDDNQLAVDLTNEKFDMFDTKFRIPLKRKDIEWRILDRLLSGADSFYEELKGQKEAKRAKPTRFSAKAKNRKRKLQP